jgi:hypothetical protein
MCRVQQCIDCPGSHDLKIGQIFTQSMFIELRSELEKNGAKRMEELDDYWNSNLKERSAISGFLKDTSLGKKRLISMPDRMSSSIKTQTGQLVFRPSPITGNREDLGDVGKWWIAWQRFMFHTPASIRGQSVANVLSLFEVIPRAKYPALSAEEEAMSVGLQTLCLALFDAVFTHLLSSIAPETWQPLKHSLHQSLYENKAASCVSILGGQYRDADVIFVQEASEAFAARAGVCLDHIVLRPTGASGRRSQMSLILARRSMFQPSTARDLTGEVLRRVEPACVGREDLCVFEIWSRDGPCLLASFHGDSDGASTGPVLAALDRVARELCPGHTLLFGLDANTTDSDHDPGHERGGSRAEAEEGASTGRAGFGRELAGRGLGSCWQGQDLGGLWTTFNARTYLQPQLHKAVGAAEVLDRRHMRLRDWVVFRAAQLSVASVARDNTGRREFVHRVMPSQAFPSDHAIVAAVLRSASGRLARCESLQSVLAGLFASSASALL